MNDFCKSTKNIFLLHIHSAATYEPDIILVITNFQQAYAREICVIFD